MSAPNKPGPVAVTLAILGFFIIGVPFLIAVVHTLIAWALGSLNIVIGLLEMLTMGAPR